MKVFTSLVAGAAILAQTAAAIPTVYQKGAKFFTSDGNQFFIKGIAYQLTDSDPLADGAQCQLDVALMKTLGTNAIRVYHVDPSADHTTCMSAFASAGIYVFVDVDTFDTYILGASPAWTQDKFHRYSAVIDAFHGFDNLAGFYVGNEDMNSGSDSKAAPYIKAAARDLKSYAASKGYRKIPIGYSASDIPALRPNLQNYLACGDDASAALDFFSLNAYEWCGDSTYSTSGYNNLQAMAQGYSIPIFFSETGCNTVKPRTFGDQAAILGPDMDDTWSGAMIYEWIEEANDYGLISYGTPAASGANVVGGFVRAGTPTPIQPDFSNLGNQWKTLNPTGVQAAAYTPSLSPPACPSYTADMWLVSGDAPLPTLGQSYIDSQNSNGTSNAAITTSASGASKSSGASNSAGGPVSTGAAAAIMVGPRAWSSGSGDSGLLAVFAGFVGFVLTAAAVL